MPTFSFRCPHSHNHITQHTNTQLDFSFNEFPVDKVTRIVEHASLLLVHSFPTHPALFLQMRQKTRR